MTTSAWAASRRTSARPSSVSKSAVTDRLPRLQAWKYAAEEVAAVAALDEGRAPAAGIVAGVRAAPP